MSPQFTKKQHIHTRYCIDKFAISSFVEVQIITAQCTKKLKAKNPIFCGSRLWDERTEKSSQCIEKAFHHEIDNAICGLGKPRNHQAISDYHLLWWSRHYYRHNPNQDQRVPGTSNDSLSNQAEINLESNGYMFVNDGVMPARFLTSVMLWGFRRSKMDRYEGLQWSLVKSQEGEFIVADCYRDTLFMPISPTKAFVAHHHDGIVTKENIAQLNRRSISIATQYYFSSNLGQCPI